VFDSPSSDWSVGAATETIVWSMNVIATAKIIAVSTSVRLLPRALGVDMCRLLGCIDDWPGDRWCGEQLVALSRDQRPTEEVERDSTGAHRPLLGALLRCHV
jgi:hypothetical protein